MGMLKEDEGESEQMKRKMRNIEGSWKYKENSLGALM
jgi:hypothetical protein